MIADNDSLSRHCPLLGHEVAFSYCRSPGQETPCRKIYDCWWETFDISSFITANYPGNIRDGILAQTKPKMLSLIELIEQARRRNAAG